jgi:hypothetical protein
MKTAKIAALTVALLLAGPTRAEEKVIADEEIAVPAHAAQMRGFSVPNDFTSVKLTINVIGKKHTDKGFSVYLLNGKGEFEKYKHRKAFNQVEAFHGLKVTRFSHTGEISPGDYAVVVANTENLLNGMTVALRVMAEPLGINPEAKARSMDRAARIYLLALYTSVKAFVLEKDRLPETLAEALPDLKPNDPWGNPYVYTKGENGSFEIISYGPDGKEGGGDDITTKNRDAWPKPGH